MAVFGCTPAVFVVSHLLHIGGRVVLGVALGLQCGNVCRATVIINKRGE